jgi:hypothetical protein
MTHSHFKHIELLSRITGSSLSSTIPLLRGRFLQNGITLADCPTLGLSSELTGHFDSVHITAPGRSPFINFSNCPDVVAESSRLKIYCWYLSYKTISQQDRSASHDFF